VSIALATKGRLWPSGGTRVIREQFVDIEVTITDPLEITMELQPVTTVTVELADSLVTVEIELVDSVTGVVIDDSDISGSTEGCF